MTMATHHLEIVECDEAGNIVATYISSPVNVPRSSEDLTRIDIVLPKESKSIWQRSLDVFLPAGYPYSVTEDYLPYQIYDSLQAFSSAIAGLLSSRAVLEGVGVGDASASPTAALLLSIFQESTGRLATILFAHKLGTSLEPECKMYRLAADIFNDTAMVLDCLSPVFPKPLRVLLYCFSSILRALCGVAAGSSKASLSAHFAKWGNLGELNAKDSSQETVISLFGMLVGSIVVSWVKSPLSTWIWMILLLTIHLSMNHAAVRAVSMRSLNRQRANIALSHLIAHDKVLTPQQVSLRERIFERNGVLRWADDSIIGHEKTGSVQAQQLHNILHIYKDESYILSYDSMTSTVCIALKRGSTPQSQLKAWCNALILARRTSTEANTLTLIADALTRTSTVFDGYAQRLKMEGWDLDIAALETRSGTRLIFPQPEHDPAFHHQKFT